MGRLSPDGERAWPETELRDKPLQLAPEYFWGASVNPQETNPPSPKDCVFLLRLSQNQGESAVVGWSGKELCTAEGEFQACGENPLLLLTRNFGEIWKGFQFYLGI